VIRWRSGEVSALGQSWPGAQELEVMVAGTPVRALAYPALTGTPEPGDRVLLNAGALELGLGTGGYALVVALPDRLPPDADGPGHLIKARYTPLQATVRTTTPGCATPTTWPGCRLSWPTCTPPSPRSWRAIDGNVLAPGRPPQRRGSPT
jgi:hypothetical protein